VQGNNHPNRTAPDHRAARHPPRDRESRGSGPDDAAWHRARRARDGGDAARDRRGRSTGARRPRLCIVGRAARPSDDGDAAECGQPSRWLHVDRERPRSGGNRRKGHAPGRRDQRCVFHPHRFHRDRHLPVPDSRTFRHGGRAGARPLPRRAAMTMPFDALAAVLVIPAAAATLLAALPAYRMTARLNVVATLLTFLAALSLFIERPQPGPYLLIDDLNNVFIVLTTFV